VKKEIVKEIPAELVARFMLEFAIPSSKFEDFASERGFNINLPNLGETESESKKPEDRKIIIAQY